MKTKKLKWDESEIQTFKDVFSREDFIELTDYMRLPNWSYGNISNPSSPSTPFFYNDLQEVPFFTEHLFKQICELTGKDWDLRRCYANGHVSGTNGAPHQDDETPGSYTFLVYSNFVNSEVKKWKPAWGGKTIFYLDFNDNYKWVLPKPNTATFFPADIFHHAEPTTRHFIGLRLSVAWKLRAKEKGS
tara:strand:- start:524 stop:1087 length:564 start_codon:yes stop_codon:yes gene_type:complete